MMNQLHLEMVVICRELANSLLGLNPTLGELCLLKTTLKDLLCPSGELPLSYAESIRNRRCMLTRDDEQSPLHDGGLGGLMPLQNVFSSPAPHAAASQWV